MERKSHINKESSSKNKKKHKKHKKHKKSKKHDGDEKEKEKEKSSSKKHKKHHRRSNDEYSSDLNNDLNSSKCKLSATTSVASTTTKSETGSTLNSKFTEIMKSNGHVVIAKAPITKFNSASNGANESKANISNKIPTDPNKLVEFMAKSLDPNTSTQVVSSASESDSIHDADSPDVAVIEEDDLNLEELTRQKALLLARLGGIAMSEDEGDKSNTPGVKSKSANNNKPIDKSKLKRPSNEPVNDVILLDDSSNDVPDKRSPPRKKQRGSSRSRSRDRSNKVDSSRDRSNNRDNRKTSKIHRNDNDNRYKEDLRKEIDRDKERNRSSPKPTHKHHSTITDTKSKFNSNKVKQSSLTSTVREREVGNKTFMKNHLNGGWFMVFYFRIAIKTVIDMIATIVLNDTNMREMIEVAMMNRQENEKIIKIIGTLVHRTRHKIMTKNQPAIVMLAILTSMMKMKKRKLLKCVAKKEKNS